MGTSTMKICLLSVGLVVVLVHFGQPEEHEDNNLPASCEFSGDLQGIVVIRRLDNGASRFSGSIGPLSPGLHGFHIHENGDLSDHCDGAGGHYNPFGFNHSSPDMGDLGNIEAKE